MNESFNEVKKVRVREIKEQISVRLPIEIVDKIHRIAEEERKSLNQVVNELVKKAFEK